MERVGVIDLHMHSTVSDGTDTPEELLALARGAGLSLFSVTDHDAIRGCVQILDALKPGDPRFIPGAEFSCRDEEGKYHILGYGYDPEAEGIRRVVELGHGYRMFKIRARLDFLRSEFGVTFPPEELEALLAMPNPGKPHIGNLMVKYGFARTREDAIRNYIDRVRFREQHVRPEEAIRGILDSGGIPVLAHPIYGDGDQMILGEELESRVRRLMEFGLQGLEGYYFELPDRLRQAVLSLAERYGLFVTAGSDYHGANKLNVLGDTGLETARPEGLARFLDAIRDRTGGGVSHADPV